MTEFVGSGRSNGMTQLVFIENNRPVTDSLTVAEVFSKEHRRVMQDIRELGCSEEFRLHHFVQSSYINEQHREMPRYIITEQGFTLLVMGYTGQRAMEFKEQYISEFDRMKAELQRQRPRELTRLELIELARESELARIEAEKRKAELEYELRLQEPKIALYEVAMQAHNTQPIGTVAKTLGIGPNKLFAFLREKKVLISQGARYNLPYQEYIDRGYFEVRQYSITHFTSGIENKAQTLVTPKGMAYIHQLLEKSKAVAMTVGV